MVLLVTDTSGKNGNVALVRTGEPETRIEAIDSASLTGGTFSAQLVPQIALLLERNKLSKSDIDAFVVISGPGSFTGLRVGLAAIKALAEILDKPIVSISLLEVIALAAAKQGKVLALLDAGRGEIYAGEYEVAGCVAHLQSEQLLSKNQLLSAAQGSTVSTADQILAEIAREAGLQVHLFAAVTPEMTAQLGIAKLRAGKVVSPDQLEANYGRRSDAEIFSKTGSK